MSNIVTEILNYFDLSHSNDFIVSLKELSEFKVDFNDEVDIQIRSMYFQDIELFTSIDNLFWVSTNELTFVEGDFKFLNNYLTNMKDYCERTISMSKSIISLSNILQNSFSNNKGLESKEIELLKDVHNNLTYYPTIELPKFIKLSKHNVDKLNKFIINHDRGINDYIEVINNVFELNVIDIMSKFTTKISSEEQRYNDLKDKTNFFEFFKILISLLIITSIGIYPMLFWKDKSDIYYIIAVTYLSINFMRILLYIIRYLSVSRNKIFNHSIIVHFKKNLKI